MRVRISPRRFSGEVKIPASKSHTIRQLLIASLADGVSEILSPLDSLDARSCVNACRAFGAEIAEYRDTAVGNPNPADEKGEKLAGWKVKGNANFKNKEIMERAARIVEIENIQAKNYLLKNAMDKEERTSAGKLHSAHISAVEITNEKNRDSSRSLLGKHQGGTALPAYDNNLTDFLNSVKGKVSKIDVGNSGTTLYLALAAAGLQSERIEFTGDEQIQKRSAAPLLNALAGLGVQCESNNGCAPIAVKGPWKGGKVSIECPTSQYLSALLIAAPLAPAGVVTEIDVPLLNEKPYIDMTLSYLKAHDIRFEAAQLPSGKLDYSRFVIPGGASWKAFSRPVPADFSSAAFPAAAAAMSGGEATLLGLDPDDTQGDKFVFEMLKAMGCEIKWSGNEGGHSLTVSRSGPLRGGTFDLNETPDLLPAAAVVAAFAEGDTALVNVAHARIKETDRIAVMAQELAKLGVECTELPDGLIIHGKGAIFPSPNTIIEGHGDHRIVMAFAAAALGSPVPIEITTAESAAVTYPGFLELLGAEVLK